MNIYFQSLLSNSFLIIKRQQAVHINWIFNGLMLTVATHVIVLLESAENLQVLLKVVKLNFFLIDCLEKVTTDTKYRL